MNFWTKPEKEKAVHQPVHNVDINVFCDDCHQGATRSQWLFPWQVVCTSMSEESSYEKSMNKENPYLNNPLHGVGLKTVLHELVSHYGFDILYAYLNINCFRLNPSLAASEKFLKKTDWAREKVEVFYLYQYKNLPAVSSEQFKLPPRERIVPEHHKPGEPAVLTIEDGERLQNKRSKNAASRNSHTGECKGSSREYNEQRNAGRFRSSEKSRNKSRYENQVSKPSYYKSADDSAESKPAPAKDPWGNFKKK